MSRLRSGWLSSGSSKMFVEELPSLRPLIVLLLVSVAIRPVAFVHVEFVGGIAAGNKIDNRALEVSARIAFEGITNH